MANTTHTWKEKTTDYQERMRTKIRHSSILPKLIKFSEGSIEMTPAQAATGLKLIGKVIPDLQSTTHEVAINHNTLNIHELNGRLASLGYDATTIWNQLNGKQVPVIEHETISQDEPTDAPGEPNK